MAGVLQIEKLGMNDVKASRGLMAHGGSYICTTRIIRWRTLPLSYHRVLYSCVLLYPYPVSVSVRILVLRMY